MPGSYLKDTSRLETQENQLSAPSRVVVKDGATPQPEEPLQIVMPTPVIDNRAGVMPPQPPAPVVPPAVTLSAAAAAAAAAAGISIVQPTPHHQQPQFAFSEMSNMTLATLVSHLVINEQVW